MTIEKQQAARIVEAAQQYLELQGDLADVRQSRVEAMKERDAANARAEAAERKLTALQASYTRGSAESEADALRAEVEHLHQLINTDECSAYERSRAAESEAAALRAELETKVYRERAEHEDMRLSLDAANARAEAAGLDRDECKRLWRIWEPKCQYFESEAAALRAEVERLNALGSHACDLRALRAAQSSLAEARALLGLVSGDWNRPQLWASQVATWLAANPEPPSAAAERSVLEAAAKMLIKRERSTRPPFVETVVCRGGGKELVEAELARREAKK
jgi:hypothetical protein